MIRRVALAFIALAATAAVGGPLRTAVVMYPGQQITHTSTGALLTYTVTPPRSIGVKFDQYGNTARLNATKPGEMKVSFEFADNRIGEVLLVSVVKRDVFDRYERATNAMNSIDGAAVSVAGKDVFVSGRLYSAADMQRCIDIEASVGAVCAAQMASAAPVVHPELGFVPRASLELIEKPKSVTSAFTSGVEGDSDWEAIVRFGDIPVLSVTESNRLELLRWALRFVSRVNAIAAAVRKSAAEGKTYPVTFHAAPDGTAFRIWCLWNFNQGSGGEVLAKIPARDLQPVTTQSGIAADRLINWWMALLQDSVRSYVLAERPLRSTGASSLSPLAPLYDNALRLRGSQLTTDSAAVALARGYFSLQFAAGRDPLADVLTTVPADFAAAP